MAKNKSARNGQLKMEIPNEDVWVPTVCWDCIRGPDLIRVHRVNGIAVAVGGNVEEPGFDSLSQNQGRVCPKPYGQVQKLYNPYRIKGPLRRTNPQKGRGIDPQWVEISWDEALDITDLPAFSTIY